MRDFMRSIALAMTVVLLAYCPAQAIDYVIHISADGLRPDAITSLTAVDLPNFYRMRTEGAFTDNARTDYDYTVTLPNHVTQLTGRGVAGAAGHNWTGNGTPGSGETLETNKGSYVAGVYDVAHDNGLRTGHYATKTKFVLFEQSWSDNGAADATGPDNGTDKIDVYANANYNSPSIMSSFLSDTAATPQNYSFLHFYDLDSAGHGSGWMSTTYLDTVETVDGYLGEVFDLIDNNATFTGKTAIIITADHGGTGTGHSSNSTATNYTIPFYVWGPGVTAGADLYDLNPASRLDPTAGRPSYVPAIQPIRNGDAANLALDMFALGPVSGSTINSAQNLAVPEPSSIIMLCMAIAGLLGYGRRRRS